jgi:hypothetical protein
MFSPDAGTVTEYGMPRRRGGHHFGSPAMQSLFASMAAGDVSLVQALQSAVNASPTLAPTVAEATITKSLVDQYGNPVTPMQQGAVATPPLQGPPPPQTERQQGQQVPGGGSPSSGVGTTTLLLGAGAFLAVMLLLKGKKR